MSDICIYCNMTKTKRGYCACNISEAEARVKELEAEVEKLNGILEILNTQLSEPIPRTYSRSHNVEEFYNAKNEEAHDE